VVTDDDAPTTVAHRGVTRAGVMPVRGRAGIAPARATALVAP
jgi:hypothetical protein